MNGSEIVARSLRRHGVEAVFFVMGGPMTALLDECARLGLRMVDVRHEQAAAMMAHAYARLRRSPAVCISSSGPGTTNLVTGIASAYVDSAPVIALAGSAPIRALGLDAFQEIDQVAMFTPITRWTGRAYETRRVADMVDTAFHHAYTGRPGPVVLDLPGDVLNGETADEPVATDCTGDRPRPLGGPRQVQRVIELLRAAERPVIFAGSGVLWSQADAEFRQFVELTGIPFFTTPHGRGVIPEDHPLCLPGSRGGAFRDCDLILLIGSRQNYVTGHLRAPRWNARAKLVQIDIDDAELGRSRPADVAILGDARAVLGQLVAAGQADLRPDRYRDWVSTLAGVNSSRAERQERQMSVGTRPIHPLRLCKEVRDFMPRDGILCVDGLVILDFARQSIPFFAPHSLNSGPFGTMGVGVPYGLGAQVAMPDKRVVVLHGDGGFGMNGMEMDTAVRLGLPIICVVHNNGGWGTAATGKVGGWLGHTRYDLMGQALGCHAELVEDPDEIRPALERAAASGKPAVINVITDPAAESQTSRFTEYATH
jgi:thiamine pyrophosphate-dependent acetolactate synthase large subunit-like protein